jgi:hypothetical protein
MPHADIDYYTKNNHYLSALNPPFLNAEFSINSTNNMTKKMKYLTCTVFAWGLVASASAWISQDGGVCLSEPLVGLEAGQSEVSAVLVPPNPSHMILARS